MKKALHSQSGFTLVEVLVVCAVVMILAGLTAPALRAAKEKSQQAECLSNMKQIALAVAMYMDDHEETFPPCIDYVSWRGSGFVEQNPADLQRVLNDYVGHNDGTGINNMDSRVWVCPVGKKFGRKGDDSVSPEPYKLGKFGTPDSWGYKHNITYRWNSLTTRGSQTMNGITGDMRAHPQKAAGIKQPSKAALLWDLPDYLTNYGMSQQLHNGKLDCLFVDGHVEPVVVIPGVAQVETLWWYVGWGPGQGWDGANVPFP